MLALWCALGSRDADYLVRRGHDEDLSTGSAPVVGVDPVIGGLSPNELEGFVLAAGHLLDPSACGFYGFGRGVDA